MNEAISIIFFDVIKKQGTLIFFLIIFPSSVKLIAFNINFTMV